MKPILIQHDKMSGPERKHADNLAIWKAAGEVVDYVYEPFRFTLADKTTFCPDFLVVFSDHFEVHEVKAGTKDKATGRTVPFCRGDESITKLKICARLYPWFRWKLYWYGGRDFQVRDIEP